jgi:hypothetical protein
MGYSNAPKGLRRLDSWLAGSAVPNALQSVPLAEALQLEVAVVRRAGDCQREALVRHAARLRAEDPLYHGTIRWIPGVYSPRAIAARDPAAALAEAADLARRLGRRVALDGPDGWVHWFDGQGQLVRETRGGVPRMFLGSRPFLIQTNADP